MSRGRGGWCRWEGLGWYVLIGSMLQALLGARYGHLVDFLTTLFRVFVAFGLKARL